MLFALFIKKYWVFNTNINQQQQKYISSQSILLVIETLSVSLIWLVYLVNDFRPVFFISCFKIFGIIIRDGGGKQINKNSVFPQLPV